MIPLRQPDTALHIRRYSPSGKVPVLLATACASGTRWRSPSIWPSSIRALWPADAATRALARSVVCEMHSGFAALRTFLPMDFTARFGPPGRLLPAVEGDVDRISAIWADCRPAGRSRVRSCSGLHHRRRDVRARLLALHDLRRAARPRVAGLCRADDGPAGDAGMGPARRSRTTARRADAEEPAAEPEPSPPSAAGGAAPYGRLAAATGKTAPAEPNQSPRRRAHPTRPSPRPRRLPVDDGSPLTRRRPPALPPRRAAGRAAARAAADPVDDHGQAHRGRNSATTLR